MLGSCPRPIAPARKRHLPHVDRSRSSTILGPDQNAAAPVAPIETPLLAAEILDRLDRASRRGRLPGYVVRGEGPAGRGFTVSAFSEPFDHELDATIEGGPAAASRTVSFRLRMLRKAPLIYGASIVLSLWPGLPIIDKLIPPGWNWWPTWTWYVPLCLLPLPFVPSMIRKSRRKALASAAEARGTIEKELAAEAAARKNTENIGASAAT